MTPPQMKGTPTKTRFSGTFLTDYAWLQPGRAPGEAVADTDNDTDSDSGHG